MGGDYTLFLPNSEFGGVIEFTLIRTNIPALTTPSGLSWHTEYRMVYDEETGISEASYERMGAMSFVPGETTQNWFAVEVYSAADSYSTPILDSL